MYVVIKLLIMMISPECTIDLDRSGGLDGMSGTHMHFRRSGQIEEGIKGCCLPFDRDIGDHHGKYDRAREYGQLSQIGYSPRSVPTYVPM